MVIRLILSAYPCIIYYVITKLKRLNTTFVFKTKHLHCSKVDLYFISYLVSRLCRFYTGRMTAKIVEVLWSIGLENVRKQSRLREGVKKITFYGHVYKRGGGVSTPVRTFFFVYVFYERRRML